ncbi:MAG: hypothetical protein HY652_08545 [Acidobacteria bacterium]|nr:hypothetical protein [Acidobacteriota bacterium]
MSVSGHSLMVHFPIALVTVAFLVDLWGYWTRQDRLRETGFLLLVLAGVGAVLAAFLGFQITGLASSIEDLAGDHVGLGVAAAAAIIVLAGWRRYLELRGGALSSVAWQGFRLAELATVALVFWTAYTGHQLR